MPSSWGEWESLLAQDDPDPLEILRAATRFERYFVAVEGAAVRAARVKGKSWDEIAQAVGRTRQAVWQKHRNDPIHSRHSWVDLTQASIELVKQMPAGEPKLRAVKRPGTK